jgi:hypothetical protein
MNAEHVMLIQVKSAADVESSATLSVLVHAVEALRTVAAPAGAVSRWLFLRAVPGGWLRQCVDSYPRDRAALCRALVAKIAARLSDATFIPRGPRRQPLPEPVSPIEQNNDKHDEESECLPPGQ